MITRFSFLTAGKPYVPGSRERQERLKLVNRPLAKLRGLISVSAVHFELSCLCLALKKKQFDWTYATDPCNSVFDDVSNHGNQMVICATPVGRIGITYIPSQLCD